MSQPNIILIMTDQQRWDTLSCLGFDHVPTPNIDRLAKRGAAFSHAFVQGAVCGPSRNSIVSSQYVHTHGIYKNEQWLTPDQPNWIELLRDGGYHTVNIGKMHTSPIRLPCGFNHRTVVENKNYRQGHHGPDPDDYDLYLAQFGIKRPACTYYQDIPDWPDQLQATVWPHEDDLFIDNCVGRWTVESIRDHDFDKPLFLWSGFAGPHDPYDVPQSALDPYGNLDIPDPVGWEGELETKPPPQKQSVENSEGKLSPATIWWSRATPEAIRRTRKHYYANICLIDDWVGRIVDEVESRGQFDNTIFIFTSDHGDCLGDHGQFYKFSSHYDSVARVPLVFAGPGVEALGEVDALTELIDLGPTLLEVTGLEPLEGAAGISLLPILRGDHASHKETVYSEHGPRIMARSREWKLVFYPGEEYGELYDLSTDPDELTNLYSDPSHLPDRQMMIETLSHWFTTTAPRRDT